MNHQTARQSRERRHRRGATMVEGTIVMIVLFILLMGMLELGLGVLRSNSLSEAARRVAREAIVRGARSGTPRAWGPSSYSGLASSQHPSADIVRKILPSMHPEDVQVELNWPDGGNDLEQRVHVKVSYEHRRIAPLPFLPSTIQLSAESTMRIAH